MEHLLTTETGKTRWISEKTEKDLYAFLKREKETRLLGGIYNTIMVSFTFNSNRIEGSTLSEDDVRCLYETKTVIPSGEAVRYDDIVEAMNHFRCIDYCIENVAKPLSETMIKEFHRKLKTGTTDGDKDWFAVGGYKKLPNVVGDRETAPPDEAGLRIRNLLSAYNCRETHTFDDIVAFHVEFERIHPFQDGNGRVGRLIMLKECLKNDVVPFIIDEGHKSFYYRGLTEWNRERGYLLETCRACQDVFKGYMDYFGIPY
ncbi:MAG: Fic family protein [Clostridia bacterium]|nr:Fic family protein [Clostridia bacterium]